MNDYKEFYPTPEELVNKMLDGVNLNYVKTVLEPSAGKGDIVQGLKSHAKYQNNENAFLIGMDEAVQYSISSKDPETGSFFDHKVS